MSGVTSLVTTRAARGLLGLFFGLLIICVYLPLATMFVFSFNSGRYQTLPFREFTFDWYVRAVSDVGFTNGLVNSLMLATGASTLAVIIGFLCAYALVRARVPAMAALTALILAPLAVPLILLGIGMRLQLTSAGVPLSLWAVLGGQTVYVLPLAIMNLRARLLQVPESLEEAAISLGAGRLRAMLEIVAPVCGTAIAATFLITFTFAFDEFVIAYFLTNFETTLPIKIWTTLVTGFDPTINAVGTGVLLFSLMIGLIAQLILLRRNTDGAAV